LFGDVLGNLKMLSHCEIYSYVFKKDPFYFRVQIALFVPYMLYDLAAELYFLIFIHSFPNLIYTVVQTEALNTVNFDILLLVDVVLPLVITIITFIFNLFLEEEKEDAEMEKVLKDLKGHQLFFDYLKREYFIENILFWDDIMNYKRLEKDDLTMKSWLADETKKRSIYKDHAKRICDKYLNGDKSLMEVNVPKREIDFIQQQMKLNICDSHSFDEVLDSVRLNLGDSFSRFCVTTSYQMYVAEMEIEKDLMDQEKAPKRMGLIGYVRKLFGNFRENVGRNAFHLSSRRRSSRLSRTIDGRMDVDAKSYCDSVRRSGGRRHAMIEMAEIGVKASNSANVGNESSKEDGIIVINANDVSSAVVKSDFSTHRQRRPAIVLQQSKLSEI